MKIDKDIATASTLPAAFYKNIELFEASRENIFARSWQLAEADEHIHLPGNAFPFTLLPGFMNEPLVLVHNESGELKCFSNVCTHRGNILVHHAGKYRKFICDYHGRRFSIDGTFEHMPEFGDAKDFP